MWEGPPYRPHSLGDGSECRHGKGLKTVCLGPTRTSATRDESIDMIRNLRTVNLITRGLPRNFIVCLPTLDCAYTIWRFLEERFLNYSLQNQHVILQKSIALSKMNPRDPKFGDCLFELHDLMRAKEMLESLAISFPKSLEFIKMHIVMITKLMNHSL